MLMGVPCIIKDSILVEGQKATSGSKMLENYVAMYDATVIKKLKENGVVRVSIKDNGEGIPEEMQSKIFTPNFTTKSSGTGLGLAMCQGIVEQAKGKIWFETKKGEGTTFFVELPLVS